MRKSILFFTVSTVLMSSSFASEKATLTPSIAVSCGQQAIQLGMDKKQVIEACGNPYSTDTDHDDGHLETDFIYINYDANQRTIYNFEFNENGNLKEIKVKQKSQHTTY